MNVDRQFLLSAATLAAKAAAKAALAAVVSLYLEKAVDRRSTSSNASFPPIHDPTPPEFTRSSEGRDHLV